MAQAPAIKISEALELAEQHFRASRLDQVEAICRQILSVDPQQPRALHLLGSLALPLGKMQAALDLLSRSVQIAPQNSLAQHDLATVLVVLGRFDEAVEHFRLALADLPDSAATHGGVGVALYETGQTNQALEHFQKAAELAPDSPESHNNLAKAMTLVGRPEEGAAAAQRAASLRSNWHEPYANLGNALAACGRVEESIDALRRAIQINPKAVTVHSNLLYLIHYHPKYDAQKICLEHQGWNEIHAEPLRKGIREHENDRSPERRLRIGYVAPDFRDHCQSFFTIPLLSSHDKEQVEIFCYADVRRPDHITERIKTYTDQWRWTAGLTNEQLAEQIRTDRVDILVDLTMHMSSGRPLLFARKPAPVQVAWLAYPSTTGQTAINYRLTDPYLDPPDGRNDQFYAEKSLRLPHSFWCYDPLTTKAIVNELPAEKNGHITFGCLSNFVKVTDPTLEMWARVLAAIPESRLLLWAPPGSHRQRAVEKLRITSDRIDFIERQPRLKYLELFHRIDLCVDTFPYNGHTTSLDAWWMGVPTVSLCGLTAVSRAGFSQASNLGLTELVATTPDEFVQLALGLANDVPRLRELRRTLRERMTRSPLMDARLFARGMENAFREMWRTWCSSSDKL